MKSISRWIFWLVLERLMISSVLAEFFTLSGPEYLSSSVYNHKLREAYCITDKDDSSLVWNYNLAWEYPSYASYNEVKKPYVLFDDKYVYPVNDNLTCQMSPNAPCSYNWEKNETWTFVTSLIHPMSPVFDNRWEDYEETKMSNQFRFVNSLLSSGSLAVSIRGTSDAHFALCNSNSRDFCFFVILGGWKNKKSVIRKCQNGIPDLPASPSDACKTPLTEYYETVLSSTEWRTFVLKWDFETTIALSIYDLHKNLLHYEEPKRKNYFTGYRRYQNSKTSEYPLFVRSSVPMLMKFHIYGYLHTKTTQSKLVSPKIMTTSSNKNMCIEMSYSVCEGCTIIVDFVDRDGLRKAGATLRNEKSNNSLRLPTWQYVKIEKPLLKQSSIGVTLIEPVTMHINTLLSNSSYKNNLYWAVSNIRRCYDDTFKITKIKAAQDYSDQSYYFWPNITCQKMSADGTSSIINFTDNRKSPNTDGKKLCSEGKIGSDCSISCSKLFWENESCQKLLTCDQSGCFCAQGFKMPNCFDRCPTSTYGFECKQKCGNCSHDSCSYATGKCTHGCANTENNYFFPPYCKKGVGAPSSPSVEPINSTNVRVILEMKEEYKLVPNISINFEVWQDSIKLVVTGEKAVHTSTVNIDEDIENLKPGTHYRTLGIVHVNNKTFRGKWKNFTTTCTESVKLSFRISSNETSITLDNRIDKHINDSCPYTWYNVRLSSIKENLFDGSTTFPKIFSELEPFFDYNIVVTSENSTIINKIVKTSEGAPSQVRELQSRTKYNSTDKLEISWLPPDKPRGIITNYTLKIEEVGWMGCSDLGRSPNITTYSTRQRVITITSQNYFSYSFEDLKPYTRYLVTVYAYTSKHQGEKAELSHVTSATEIPTEKFISLHLTNETTTANAAILRWSPPSDCSTITGPIIATKLLIKKLGMTYMELKTRNYYFPLDRTSFYGTETYEASVYPLRDLYASENKSAYTTLTFTMPAREPPPVQYIEIIEVDICNKTTTLRWGAPLPPLHGQLDYYSITFCNPNSCHDKKYFVHFDEYCDLWNLPNTLCKNILLPSADFNRAQVKAHNANVTEGSEPKSIRIKNAEFVPDAPLDLDLSILHKENASVNVTWDHPLKSGGRLKIFEINVHLTGSSLKFQPWQNKTGIYEIGVVGYQPQYSIKLDLLPSSIFEISVKAMTIGGLSGKAIKATITLQKSLNFNVYDLKPKVNDDLTITIKIPEIINDVKGSVIIVLMQGPKYCDEGKSNNEDANVFLDTQISSYYKTTWKAATLMEPESYANKEFIIGDGKIYGGSKNYALCSKESYIIHLVLIDNPKNLLQNSNEILGVNILKSLKTDAIPLGDLPTNYAMWLTPLFFIFLVAMLLTIVIYRKKLAHRFLTNKTINRRQENMPLSNDFSKKKSNNSFDGVEDGKKFKSSTDMPNNNLFIIDNKTSFVTPVKIKDFSQYFESSYRSGALKKEYSSMKNGPTKPCSYGSQLEVKPKNRYATLYPYDDSRVILENIPDEPYSDYINANFITGYKGKEKAYIATQGPKPNTVVDFWRMIWQEKVQIICMMTNLIENEKIKCEQYWPSAAGKKVLYGKIAVHFLSEEVHCDYTYRIFQVSCGNQETRSIKHLHYTAWPDHGVPSNLRSIVAFLKEIQKHAPAPRKADDPPITVHCSAGVGRTGTLVVLDMSVCRAFSEQVIDVFADTMSVRKERLNMVGNTDQYLLMHLVLVEYLNSSNTYFPCDKALPERIAEAKKDSKSHYERIVETSWWNEILGSPLLPEKSISNKNRAKHRFPESAGSLNRLYLKRSVPTDEDSDYIAATWVRGIFKDCQYITTQLPLPTTAADFWRMLSEQNVEFVLVLQLPNLKDSTYCELMPENREFGSTKYLKIIREEDMTTDLQYYYKKEVILIDSSEQPAKKQKVKIITYKNWPESSLPSPNELVKLWKAFEELPKTSNSPIVTVCCNGVTVSGLWLAISFLLKRMTVDKECDVSQAVTAVRRCRRDFLSQPSYLEFLYDVALAWSTES